MPQIKDLTLKKFGRLTVIRQAGKTANRKITWICLCDCGTVKELRGGDLKTGKIVSCGCYRLEQISSHGKSTTKEYRAWGHMKDRCYNNKSKSYHNYGKRGIDVCSEWRESFAVFFFDMGYCPKGHTLERIDNEKGYSFDNCKWATWKEQEANKRTNVVVKHNGQVHLMKDWSRILNIPLSTLRGRYKRHKSLFLAGKGG